jgi:hypothetical protein
MVHDVQIQPVQLPGIGNDFDWQLRDYESFRIFMLEELAARFPQRRHWTPADIEVVIIEVLASVLDQLSDMTDRVCKEAYLATARQPENMYRLLKLIGYDAIKQAGMAGLKDLLSSWLSRPEAMEKARKEGPACVHRQMRMVTVADYTQKIQEHPLVLLSSAQQTWGGSWFVIHVVVRLYNDISLDENISVPKSAPKSVPEKVPEEVTSAISRFHLRCGLADPLQGNSPITARCILSEYIEAYRMISHEVVLLDMVPVYIDLDATMILRANYYANDVRTRAQLALGNDPGGFFIPGNRGFGEGIHLGDIYQILTELAGVEKIVINRFKRSGELYTDQTAGGFIRLHQNEIAVGFETLSLRTETKRRTL